jgi:hypothetical protein
MCENCAKKTMLDAEIETSRYSPLRFHAETFRHMDDLHGQLEDLLGELQRLRSNDEGLDLIWYAKTIVDNSKWH